MKAGALVLSGDWNAELGKDLGMFSPAWLARTAGLTVFGCGPGRHGNIDYALAAGQVALVRRARCGNGARRAGEEGSDHDAIRMTVARPDGTTLRMLTWNMQRDRRIELVLSQLQDLNIQHRPHVMVLQEANQYVAALRYRYPDWHLITGDHPATQQNVIMVRRTQIITGHRVVQLSQDGWVTVQGKEHAPVYAPTVVVDGWCRFVGIHMPPSVNWRPKRSRVAAPFGPIKRVAVMVTSMRKLRSWTHHWKAEQ